MLVVPPSAGVVLPQHVHAGEPEHLEKQWQEAVAPVLTEQNTIAGDLALRVGSLESEVNVAIAARLEKLEKEVFAVSCRLQVNQTSACPGAAHPTWSACLQNTSEHLGLLVVPLSRQQCS